MDVHSPNEGLIEIENYILRGWPEKQMITQRDNREWSWIQTIVYYRPQSSYFTNLTIFIGLDLYLTMSYDSIQFATCIML